MAYIADKQTQNCALLNYNWTGSFTCFHMGKWVVEPKGRLMLWMVGRLVLCVNLETVWGWDLHLNQWTVSKASALPNVGGLWTVIWRPVTKGWPPLGTRKVWGRWLLNLHCRWALPGGRRGLQPSGFQTWIAESPPASSPCGLPTHQPPESIPGLNLFKYI